MDNYLGSVSEQDISTSQRSNIAQGTPRPVYQMPIPERRPDAAQCSCSRNLPLEFLSQVNSYFDKIVRAYFENLYPAFPVLEEACFKTDLNDRPVIPRTFMVNFVAYVIFYWNMAPELISHARPDQDFAWQVAVQAMNTDIQKGDISAIVSAIFNVAGRPSKGFVSNMTSVSRIVALSHSCGLNHDSRRWKVTEQEKRLRWKMWWAILIHDRWLNFAQGTPPQINKAHYDVPLPSIELLAADRIKQQKHYRAAECYIELCKLTEIIGDVLPLIYYVRAGNDGLAAEQTSRSEIDLNRWLANRPKWLDYHEFENRPDVPGLPNLQLSYLAVRMLLRRIAWYETTQKSSNPSPEWLQGCLEAAEQVVHFTCTLKPPDLAGFWLPYNARHFNSAVSLLLRCGIQTEDFTVRRRSMANARALVDCLRRFKDENDWDMAEEPLAHCENDLRRIESCLPKTPAMVHQSILQTAGTSQVDESFWDNPMLQYQGFGFHGQPEELFDGIFSEFVADNTMFEPFAQVQQYHQ